MSYESDMKLLLWICLRLYQVTTTELIDFYVIESGRTNIAVVYRALRSV